MPASPMGRSFECGEYNITGQRAEIGKLVPGCTNNSDFTVPATGSAQHDTSNPTPPRQAKGPGLSASQRRELERSLIALVERREFPCVGAKSALAQGSLEITAAWSITSAWDDLRIHDALVQWSEDYDSDAQGFRSFAVVFSGPDDLDEPAFERALWERLGSLIAKDGWRGNEHDPKFSDDPADPHFALSFGGRAYFAVGLHPHASRRARQTPYPTIVFNLHDQFVRLREEQRYERMREVILTRDAQFDGTPNPMVAEHGEISEARQYSGRAVGDDWECPLPPRSDQ